MLALLRIQNFALIDHLELPFGLGLNVLTGETGAGKSIILDAIDLVLGGKASGRMIRQGAEKAILEATFTSNLQIEAWLTAQAIDRLEDDTLVCSREITLSGENLRSRSRVNGVLVNRQQLSELRQQLVEITAQGQTVSLMDGAHQRSLLDNFGGNKLTQQRQVVARAYEVCQAAKKSLEKRRQSEQERLQKQDLYIYQLKELEAAELINPDEREQLEQERDRLSHVVELQQMSYQAYQFLYQNDQGELAIADLLGKVETILADMMKYDSALEPLLDMIRNAATQVVEAGYQINSYGDSLEVDPDRLSEVEDRIALLKQICRKYGPRLVDAVALQNQLQRELDGLTGNGESLEELEQAYGESQEQLKQSCQLLTDLRKKAASQLEKQLVRELKPLAMDKVIFVCQINPISPTVTGADQVVFYFSPNPGEKIQPLSETASGGEMSRFLLALKSCFAQAQSRIETLIFDEIDAGVSGKVAQAIAEKLHHLSQVQQVLCVTHQPLIAAMADDHFRVDKQMIEELTPKLTYNSTHDSTEPDNQATLSEIRTVIRVTNLEQPHHRRDELALLTGGHSAQEAIAFAESLLVKARAYRDLKVSSQRSPARKFTQS
jgi:DNA repair protein RecN (Recombination protein N)